MKNLLILILLSFISLNLNAQYGKGNYKNVASLERTKTYVVLHDYNETFNKYITNAVKENWTLTKYEFISFDEVWELAKNEKNSFLIVSGFAGSVGGGVIDGNNHFAFYTNEKVMIKVAVRGGTSTYQSTALVLQPGGKRFKKIDNWFAFSSGGLGNGGFHCKKMDVHVNLIQNAVKIIKKEKLKRIKWRKIGEHYNKKGALEGKTVIFWDDEIPKKSTSEETDTKFLNPKEIEKRFSGDFKIVSMEEMDASLEEKNKDYLYFISFTEGAFSAICLSDYKGNVVFYSPMATRVTTNTSEWWGLVLDTLNKGTK